MRMDYDRSMALTDRDRDYMRRLGEFEAEGHAAALRDHLSLSIDERLRRSLLLYRQFIGHVHTGLRDDDPSQFYDHARRLALYLP